MTRPRGADIPAVLVGLAGTSWTALLTGPTGRLPALAAGVAVLVAVVWRPAATLAGCLLVAGATFGAVAVPAGLALAGLAVAAALLTGYLVLVDTTIVRPVGALVPAATVVAGLSAVTLAAAVPSRAWMAPFGMAAAATALIVAVLALRRDRPDRR